MAPAIYLGLSGIMSLPQVFIASIETALNRYLALDEQTFSALADLQGRIIEIHLQGLNTSLYLFPDEDGIMVLGDFDGEADTRLIGTPIALAKLGLARNPADVLFSGEVSIEGDTRLGQQFKKILARMDIDWEEQLSRYSGDILAHQIGNGVRALSGWLQRNQQSAALDTGEYLQDEIRLLPSAGEVRYFIRQVDALRDDTERLQARLQRLQSGSEPKEEKSND